MQVVFHMHGEIHEALFAFCVNLISFMRPAFSLREGLYPTTEELGPISITPWFFAGYTLM
jgi:hypothetical protein